MIEKLNHYSITSPASVYDEEALTALELAGRTAAKANECIDAFNKLETDTGNKLEAQNNFIEKMNSVTMPEKVKTEVNKHIQNGDFDKAINTYLGDLLSRLDNLIGHIPEGSTTMDAEVIDGRVNSEGVSFENLGSNLRNNFALLFKMLEHVESNTENIEAPTELGYYDENGMFQASTKHGHATIPVITGEIYEITAFYGQSINLGFAMGDQDFIFAKYPSNIALGWRTHLLIVPDGASFLVINSVNNHPVTVRKVTEFKATVNHSFLNNLVKNFDGSLFNNEISPTTIYNNMVIQNGELIETTNTTNRFNLVEFNVNEGEIYRINGRGYLECHHYAFKNKHDDYIYFSETYPKDVEETINKLVLIPEGVTKLVVTDLSGQTKCYARTTSSGVKEWSGLKWCVVGDSLTEVNSRTSKNYHHYIAEKTGITVVNMGSSGTGYKRSDDQNKAFYQRISNVPTDSDVITIFGSGNDLGAGVELGEATDTGTNTLCGAINTTIDNLYKIKPVVRLGIVSPTPWQGNEPSNNGSMSRYAEKLKEICALRGIPFLDLFHTSNLRPNDATFRTLAYSKDDGNGVHPDETGHKIIASQFYNFLISLIGGV